MIAKETLFRKLENVLGRSKADETEICVYATDSGLTRFANSAIHQNVHESNCQITFRSVIDNRIGLVSTNSLAVSDLNRARDHSCDIARFVPGDSDFPGVARPAKYRTTECNDLSTSRCAPRTRANAVKKIITIADRQGFDVAGTFVTSTYQFAVLNTRGVRAYHPQTTAATSIIAMSKTSSGYAAGYSHRVGDLNIKHLAQTAVEKCKLSQNPIDLAPGEYEVILEPPAVAELLVWLGYLGFRSKQFEDGASFMCGKIGEQITSEMITICDDASDRRTIPIPFDFEGVPRKKVILIDKGVARAVVHSRTSARRQKTRTTGHAMFPQWAHYGAFALHLRLSPGAAKRSEMLTKIKKGILVTRFHYVRGRVDTPDDILSGMTRDGTFLIENGKIRCGIKNLRFTDSVLRAFATARNISKETDLVVPEFAGMATLAPTVHLGSFRFTGKTDF